MNPPAPGSRKKIAILGGGMGSLAAAYGLTCAPDWQSRYEITVYQLGWRLGGKGASGRNAAHDERIEEHGLHVWMGFYENAFRIMRQCYAEMGRAPGDPLATWTDAFKPHSYVVWEDENAGRWSSWAVDFPTNGSTPGDGGVLPTPWDYVRMMVEWMVECFEGTQHGVRPSQLFTRVQPLLHERAGIRDDIAALGRGAPPPTAPVACPPLGSPPPTDDELHPLVWLASAARKAGVAIEATYLHLARELVRTADPDPHRHANGEHEGLIGLLRSFRTWWLGELDGLKSCGDDLRRAFILVDLAAANTCGLIADCLILLETDWTVLDGQDYKAWLLPHCIWSGTPDCAPVRAFYDLVFSLADGIAAGTTLVCAMRMMLTYKGAIFYKMQAGMGDTVFAPLYLVLRKRGVKFEFFQRVEALHTADAKTVTSIDIAVQATLPPGTSYDPLKPVRGLPCWPSTPRYEQLEQGAAIEAGGYDLESAWTDWIDPGHRTLVKGRDFDDVVLGISIAAHPFVCPELLAASPKMKSMVDGIRTTATQAAQLWLEPDLAGMGWCAPSPVMTSYIEPFDTWADMSQLLPREGWRPGCEPGNISYFCGALQLTSKSPPPGPDPEYPRSTTAQARADAIAWMSADTGALWPRASTPDGGLDWSKLTDPEGREGIARFDAQYWRANVNPTDRYVQSVPGTTQYRLRNRESGFDNLVFAGDWVRTRLNGGCIEAATMSGLQASQSICGYPTEIIGDPDYTPPSPPTPGPPPGPPTPSGGLPPYIERGGNLVLRGPYLQSDTRLFSFVLAADHTALTGLCDSLLNAPLKAAKRPERYKPLAPFATLVCANIGRLQSLDPRDSQKGHMSELDIGFWLPLVAGVERDDGSFDPQRLVWFLPYIFVDSPPAMATGREIFGFPKESGALCVPRDTGDRAAITADVIVLPTYAPGTLAVPARVAEVDRVDKGPVGAMGRVWHSVGELATAALGGMRTLHANGGLDCSWTLLLNLFEEMMTGSMPMVFLQQFRDVQHTGGSAYQAIVEAPAVVAGFRGAGLLQGDYRVTVGQYASHPIASDLGLASTTLSPLMSVYVDFDFRMDLGRVVWNGGRAPAE